jgi:DNA invertase Pin-like site-specific DNA recombinase
VEEKRHALRRLLRNCKAGVIDAVILASLDRLSRSLRFAENLFYEFERLGVNIYIVDMPPYDGRDRKEVLIRQIKEAAAECLEQSNTKSGNAVESASSL